MAGRQYENPKRTSRHQTANFYLGAEAEREERLKRMDELVILFGADSRSALLQMLLDGKLKLVRK